MTHHVKTTHCLWRACWPRPRWGDRELRFPREREVEGDVEFTLRLKGRRWWGTRVSEPLRRCESSVRMLRWQGHYLAAQTEPAALRDRRYLRSLQEMAQKRAARRKGQNL